MVRNRSCPAVSQICSFIVFLPIFTVRKRKSTPIVEMYDSVNASSCIIYYYYLCPYHVYIFLCVNSIAFIFITSQPTMERQHRVWRSERKYKWWVCVSRNCIGNDQNENDILIAGEKLKQWQYNNICTYSMHKIYNLQQIWVTDMTFQHHYLQWELIWISNHSLCFLIWLPCCWFVSLFCVFQFFHVIFLGHK